MARTPTWPVANEEDGSAESLESSHQHRAVNHRWLSIIVPAVHIATGMDTAGCQRDVMLSPKLKQHGALVFLGLHGVAQREVLRWLREDVQPVRSRPFGPAVDGVGWGEEVVLHRRARVVVKVRIMDVATRRPPE